MKLRQAIIDKLSGVTGTTLAIALLPEDHRHSFEVVALADWKD